MGAHKQSSNTQHSGKRRDMRHPSLIAGGHTPYQSMTAFILCRCTRCFWHSKKYACPPCPPKKYVVYRITVPYYRSYYCTHPHDGKNAHQRLPLAEQIWHHHHRKKKVAPRQAGGCLLLSSYSTCCAAPGPATPPILALSSTTLRLLNLSPSVPRKIN